MASLCTNCVVFARIFTGQNYHTGFLASFAGSLWLVFQLYLSHKKVHSPRLAIVNRVMDTGAQYCIDTEACCQNYVAPLHELDEQEFHGVMLKNTGNGWLESMKLPQESLQGFAESLQQKLSQTI